MCPLSFFGQGAGNLLNLPSEEKYTFHSGAGLHGEGVQLRGGQKVLPRHIPHGEPTVNPLLISSNLLCASVRKEKATVQLQMFTYAVLFLLQDIFWSVYVGKCIIKRIVHYCLCISTALQLINFSVFRWRSVRREALQEWSHVFRQCWRL